MYSFHFEKCVYDFFCSRISHLTSSTVSLEEEFKHIQLDDLDVIATLGVGGFGRVQLVSKIFSVSLNIRIHQMKM